MWRRAFLLIALIVAGVALGYAVKPFAGPSPASLDPPDPVSARSARTEIAGFSMEMTAVVNEPACGSSLVDSWHSEPFRWRIHTNPAGSQADFTATATGSTCRKAAQHRVRRAGFGLLAAAVLALAGVLLLRPRVD